MRLTPQDAVDTENGIVEIKARVLVPSSNRYCVDIDGFDNPPREYSNRAFHVRFYPDGTVSYYREKKNPIPDVTIKTDTWQEVFMRADMRQATFDLTIEGQTATGLPFGHDGIHRIQSIGICPNTSKCTMYVDEVSVRVIPRDG